MVQMEKMELMELMEMLMLMAHQSLQLALQIGASGHDTSDYRSLMEDIQERQGHPYRDIRYRNQYRRDRQLYNQLLREQQYRDSQTNSILRSHLPPELVRIIQDYRHADENRYIERVTNRRR